MSLSRCRQLDLISLGFRFVVGLAQRETVCRVQTDMMNDLFCMLWVSWHPSVRETCVRDKLWLSATPRMKYKTRHEAGSTLRFWIYSQKPYGVSEWELIRLMVPPQHPWRPLCWLCPAMETWEVTAFELLSINTYFVVNKCVWLKWLSRHVDISWGMKKIYFRRKAISYLYQLY